MSKVLGIVIENYVSGGSDAVANQLARYLPGWSIVILMNRGNDDRNLTKGLDLQKVRLIRYGWKTLAEFGAVPIRLRKHGHPVLAFVVRCCNLLIRYPHILLSAFYFGRIFRSYGIDCVISNNGGYPGGEMCRSAMLGARLRGVKALMIVHNMPTSPPKILLPMEIVMDWLIGQCGPIICVSAAVSDGLVRCRFLKARAEVIENAVEGPPVRLTDRSHATVTDILVVGSISPLKDQIKAVMIYRLLVSRVKALLPSIEVPMLALIGPVADADYASALNKVIKADKIEGERITLVGYDNPQKYFARVGQLLLISSNREGLPLVLLEAMSHGIPTVSTNAGGIGDVIAHGLNGALHEIDDIEGLADSLWRYISDPASYSRASRHCIEIFNARYSVEGWISKYRVRLAELYNGT